MNLTSAAASLECQSALVEGPAAARAALAKHGASIASELALALEKVGSYTRIERGRTSLYGALINGDAATVEAIIVAGARLIDIKSNGVTPLDLATDDTCREILDNHAALYASITEDPYTLVFACLAHCANLSTSEEPSPVSEEFLPVAASSLRAHYFDSAFLWAPTAARAAVVIQAQHVFIAQLAATIQPFERLPLDCAGEILEFFEIARNEFELIAKHCSSPEACAWVGAVVAAAVVAKATAELESAAEEDDSVTVQDCLSKGAYIDTKDELDFTPLMRASHSGRTETVQLLAKAGADKDSKSKDNGFTALMWASIEGHTATAQILVELGADKDAVGRDGNTALMRASYWGHNAIVQLLLDAGANKHAKNDDGWTALICASSQDNIEATQILLEAGADKDAMSNDGSTALIEAGGCTAIVQLLVKAGADMEAKRGDGSTALIIISRFCAPSTVQTLLEAGADKDAKSSDGSTALIIATNYGHIAIVRLLVEAGADMESKRGDGTTALIIATNYGHIAIVQLLVEAGADMESKRGDGSTPLMIASRNSDAEIVQVLLGAGANKEAKANDGKTALEYAEERGNTAVLAVLKK